MRPAGTSLQGDSSEGGIGGVANLATETSDGGLKFVIRVNQIGVAATGLGVAIDVASGVVDAERRADDDFPRQRNVVAEVDVDVVRFALGVAVGVTTEQSVAANVPTCSQGAMRNSAPTDPE